MTRTLADQLAAPHPDGTAIALYRTRVYRFAEDTRHYVLAEALEEKWAQGSRPAPATLAYLNAVLDRIRATSRPLPFDGAIAAAEGIGDTVMAVDNKNTRVVPGLVMPYEAEDLYARAIPAYRHLGGHTYDLTAVGLDDPGLLTAGIQAHIQHFGRPDFITKSPFNSLRIPEIDAATGRCAVFLSITRDQAGTADSMRRNRFRFLHEGRPLTEEAAWELFTTTIERDAPPERTIHVTHHELLIDEANTMARVHRLLSLHS